VGRCGLNKTVISAADAGLINLRVIFRLSIHAHHSDVAALTFQNHIYIPYTSINIPPSLEDCAERSVTNK